MLEHERVRAEVVSKEYARLARLVDSPGLSIAGPMGASTPALQRFRDQFFGGRRLTKAEVTSLFTSHAAALLPYAYFGPGLIPAIGHTYQVIEYKYDYVPDANMFRHDFVIDVTWPGLKTPGRHELTRMFDDPLPGRVVWEQGDEKALLAFPNSLLDFIRVVSEFFAGHYGWSQRDAVWFVLTDKPPVVPCFSLDLDAFPDFDHNHSRLRIAAFPWISAQTILRQYRTFQRDVLGQMQNRPTSIASLNFFDFVSARRTCPAPMPWRQILLEWDKSAPRRERFGVAHVQNFQRNYERIRGQVVFMRSDQETRRVRQAKKTKHSSAKQP